MGTTEKAKNAELKKLVRRAWKQAKGQTFSTAEILDHLERVRTCFTALTNSMLEGGDLGGVKYCLDRIDQITSMFERIENGRAQADVEASRTIWAQPIVFETPEAAEFQHLVAGGMMGDA